MNKEKYNKLTFSILILLIILCGFNALKYGMVSLDESWYVAEPWLVMEGRTPGVDIWTQSPFFVIPIMPIVWIYNLFFSNFDGIFLFMRAAYLVVKIVIILMCLFFVKKGYAQKIDIVMLLPLVLFAPNNGHSLCYNTISVLGVFLSDYLVLCINGHKYKYLLSFLSGLCIAAGVLGNPIVVFICIINLLILLIKDWKQAIGYSMGGVSLAVLVISYISISGKGLLNLINGLQILLRDGVYFKIQKEVDILQSLPKGMYLPMCILFSIILFEIILCRSLKYKRQINLNKLITKTVIIFFTVSFVISIVGYREWKINGFTYAFWYAPIVSYLVMDKKKKFKYKDKTVFFFIDFFVYYIISSSTCIFGFYQREYLLFIPSLLGVIMLLELLRDDLNIYKFEKLIRLATIILMTDFLCYSYMEMPRDDVVQNLDTCFTSGVYKGIYTTNENEQSYTLLEQYIKNNTNIEEKILFLDFHPYAYLMSNGSVMAPTTLDSLAYGYKHVDSDMIMKEYFYMKNEIPDKIFYIQKKDTEMSIDDDKWMFNSFVETNYYKKEKERVGIFTIQIYNKKENISL